MSDFHDSTLHRKCRKNHRCEACDGPITKGEPLVRQRGQFEGSFYHRVLHPICADIWAEGVDDDGYLPDFWDALCAWLEKQGLSEEEVGACFQAHKQWRFDHMFEWYQLKVNTSLEQSEELKSQALRTQAYVLRKMLTPLSEGTAVAMAGGEMIYRMAFIRAHNLNLKLRPIGGRLESLGYVVETSFLVRGREPIAEMADKLEKGISLRESWGCA